MTGVGGLFGELFADAELSALLSEEAFLQSMLDFEALLAKSEAQAGLFPPEIAMAIAAQCRAELYDIAEIGRAATLAGNPAIPLVKALTARVAQADAEAAKWVHHGATSQDVIDSAAAWQIDRALQLICKRLLRLTDALAGLARTHRATPMIGRTFLQQAVPIPFGLKLALWLDPLLESHARLRDTACQPHLQLAGAAGSLASLGEDAERVQMAFRELGDAAPAGLVSWHSQRHRQARLASELGILLGSLGKMARDVALMAQTEIGELAEPEAPGKGGSSAMPHKRNPVLCTLILAAAQRAPGLVSTMLVAMPQEHERGLGGWHAEWPTMPELLRLAGSALVQSVTLIEGLQVFPERMRANIELTNGLVMSERVALALAPRLGKGRAHELVEQASRECTSGGKPLRQILADMPEIATALDATQLDALFDPASYRGASDAIIDRVLARHDAMMQPDA